MSAGTKIPHDSSVFHVTGRSEFIDDRPLLSNEVFVGVVGAPIASGRILKIETTEVLKMPGILACFDGRDFAHNRWGTIVEDQPILAFERISYIDEPVCLIVGSDRQALKQAYKKIKIEVEEEKFNLSIDEAIKRNNFLYQASPMKTGDAEGAKKKAPHRLNGSIYIGGQEHFYLESHASVVYPLEGGSLEIHSSSQHPTETQHVVADALGLKYHQVTCIVKRMGGGFGGKESQAAPFAAMAALVAQKLGRPARVVLSKDDDMKMTGKRHPFKSFYEVGFDDHGKILALKLQHYADGGAYTDLSPSILDRALFHSDGAYYIENVDVQGFVCRTNSASNTAFRGFGGPQGNLVIESIVEDIAAKLNKDPLEIRKLNLYGKLDRNVTHYGQKVEHNFLPDLLSRVAETSQYQTRSRDVKEFNAKNVGKVRGLSLSSVKFGIAFTARHLNQANALVNIHRDGTVQVSTGATEMGQGVNTKIQQVVASSLGVPWQDVKIMSTSTEKNANTSPTAASSGTDLNAAAALRAVENVKKRLNWLAFQIFEGFNLSDTQECPPLDEDKLRNITVVYQSGSVTIEGKSIELGELVEKAYLNRISLSDYAHFKTEGLGFDKKAGRGTAFKYFTSGVAITEVEVDEYTGQYKVVRVDLAMDIGQSINPGIDRGQITGAFIQGMGWLTTENLFYDAKGRLLSHSPTTYKIPNIQDTPRIFNVEFIDNPTNTENVFRSKAVGEPPFLLGISVFTALKRAIFHRTGQVVALDTPATPEKVLMALNHA